MSRMAAGRLREHRPEVESADQAARPVACMAARQVSMPSPTISTSPGSARRTAPPRQGPSIIFCRSTGAFPLLSRARKARWVASGVSLDPRVKSVTIAGQIPPEGCVSPAWNRSVGDSGS
jgi:hypothetical protein